MSSSMICIVSLMTISIGMVLAGDFTYYDVKGYSACGPTIDANTQMLAAVSPSYFPSGNPNNAPICKKCVQVTYKGKSVKVPIKDKCPGCAKEHIDLSVPAFKKLAPTSLGHGYGAGVSIVNC
ncbi:Rare lipoprotein A (RlpA)-like double-psi beta-barrel [Aphelenchoides bicaudatus]|nr:Rare lipoprotein A (RlpA)-like double-psi beta-barrel [Aphelenchoides bicaudatus]